jgi:hypothetical protein
MKPTKSILSLLLFLTFSCDDNSVEPLVCDGGLTNVDGVCTLVCDEGLTNVDGVCTLVCDEGLTEVEGECLDECGEVNGDNSTCLGCDDVPNSGIVNDAGGVCGGSGIPEGNCNCDGNTLDECGVCGGNGIPEGNCDCNGNVLDECGVCGGDSTICIDDCGVVNGPGSDCGGSCNNENVEILGNCYNIDTTTSLIINETLFSIPNGIWDLINLEVLNLWGTYISSLPDGIGNLINLQEL